MGDMEDDLYKVLGLAGPNVSKVEIRKAYRGLALIWHPDKQGGKKPTEVAAAVIEFEKIQKAHDVLGDEKARNAYDELFKIRKSRLDKEKNLSSKRQKMMQDLRDRERSFETERAERREEDLVAKRLQAELARLRTELARNRNGHSSFDPLSDLHSSARSQSGIDTESQPVNTARDTETQNTFTTTLKVSWACTDGGAGGYSATRLKEIFQEFGEVEDVVIRSGNTRKRGSGLVVMTSKEAAIAATETVCGDFSNPLEVVPMMPKPTSVNRPAVEFANPPTNGLTNVFGSGYRSHENEILTKLRHAAERARIIKEMQEADSKGL